MNYAWMFPRLEFRSDGTVISRKRLSKNGHRNPNYGKVLSWRRHPIWGMIMLEGVDRFSRRTTIYKHHLEKYLKSR